MFKSNEYCVVTIYLFFARVSGSYFQSSERCGRKRPLQAKFFFIPSEVCMKTFFF